MHTYTLKKFQTAFNLDLEVNLSVKLPTQYPDHLNHMRLDVGWLHRYFSFSPLY